MGAIVEELQVVSDPVQIAEDAGLRYVTDTMPGYTRERNGDSYLYFNQYGDPIESERTIQRINKLVIPHIWQNVWICPLEKGHLQATGVDGKNRKQYRYHKEWAQARSLDKFSKMLQFGHYLPQIRQRIHADMNQKKLSREKVLATVITLLDEKLIRIGNKEYEQRYKTYGLTTLKNKHVKNMGGQLLLHFNGKKNVEKKVIITDRKLASIIKKCKELPGYDLFQYIDEDGNLHAVNSEDVNNYIKEISGEAFTAKDFRTWGGSCVAIKALLECEPCESEKEIKKNITAVVKQVSGFLGNTPTVCKNYYIHPQIFEKYSSQDIIRFIQENPKAGKRNDEWMNEEELIFLDLLQSKF